MDESRLLTPQEIVEAMSDWKDDSGIAWEDWTTVMKAQDTKTLKEVIYTLKNYGISITNEGILVPYSDEWDYLYDTPRRVLLKGNDKGESCLKLWESIGGELPKE